MTGIERRGLIRIVSAFFLLATLAMAAAWLTIGPGGLRGSALYFHTLAAVPFVIGWVVFSWLPSFADPASLGSRRLHASVGLAGFVTAVLAALAMGSWFGTEPMRVLIASHAWSGVITLVGLIAFVALEWLRRSTPRR